VLGPGVNSRWLNALAALVVGVLVVLSTLLTITTILPDADVTRLCVVLFGAFAVELAIGAASHDAATETESARPRGSGTRGTRRHRSRFRGRSAGEPAASRSWCSPSS
jgi:hypothetical protein